MQIGGKMTDYSNAYFTGIGEMGASGESVSSSFIAIHDLTTNDLIDIFYSPCYLETFDYLGNCSNKLTVLSPALERACEAICGLESNSVCSWGI